MHFQLDRKPVWQHRTLSTMPMDDEAYIRQSYKHERLASTHSGLVGQLAARSFPVRWVHLYVDTHWKLVGKNQQRLYSRPFFLAYFDNFLSCVFEITLSVQMLITYSNRIVSEDRIYASSSIGDTSILSHNSLARIKIHFQEQNMYRRN